MPGGPSQEFQGFERVKESEIINKRFISKRVFNIKNGLTCDVEVPSTCYGSTPVNGPAKGKGIIQHWNLIREIYYQLMGWNSDSGEPLPATLKDLGLEDLILNAEY